VARTPRQMTETPGQAALADQPGAIRSGNLKGSGSDMSNVLLSAGSWDDGAEPLSKATGRIAGLPVLPSHTKELPPGTGFLAFATGLLFLLAAGMMAVSLRAQYVYVYAIKHETWPSTVEALGLDAGMIIFALLGMALARAGKSARVERGFVLMCALGSAGMNLLASDIHSPRSVVVYVMPPILFAIASDRVIGVIRRHVLGEDESSVWSVVGKFLLYATRLILAPAKTAKGLRLWLLASAPLPTLKGETEPQIDLPGRPEITSAPARATKKAGRTHTSKPRAIKGETKKSRLLALYAAHPLYGDRAKVSRVASEIAAEAQLQPGTARTYLYSHLDGLGAGGVGTDSQAVPA
jgi:Protein of unknown function (DUF2637)